MFNNLKFYNVQLKIKGDNAVFIVTIINETNEDVKLGQFKVILKDKYDNVIRTVIAYAGDIIKSGSSVSPYISVEGQIEYVYTLEYQEY